MIPFAEQHTPKGKRSPDSIISNKEKMVMVILKSGKIHILGNCEHIHKKFVKRKKKMLRAVVRKSVPDIRGNFDDVHGKNFANVHENGNKKFCLKSTLRVLYCISEYHQKMREG